MAVSDPLRETQEFDAMRDALRRAVSSGETPPKTQRKPVVRRRKRRAA